MKNSVALTGFGAVFIALTAAGSASATPLTFDFNSLSSSANNAAVQSYMNGKLGTAGSVVVAGSQADHGYAGEGYVVGPGSWWSGVDSLTLGNTDGATKDGTPYTANKVADTFLTNQPGVTNSIVMKFSGLTIASVSFDYEIFPDNGCANGNTCGTSNYPDFTFKVNGTNQIFHSYGVMPGTNGTYSYSPNDSFLSEKAPQLLATTGLITLGPGVTELDFIDWPAAIGIDNLKIDYTSNVVNVQAVPEPASLLLFGTGVLGVGYQVSRRKKK